MSIQEKLLIQVPQRPAEKIGKPSNWQKSSRFRHRLTLALIRVLLSIEGALIIMQM